MLIKFSLIIYEQMTEKFVIFQAFKEPYNDFTEFENLPLKKEPFWLIWFGLNVSVLSAEFLIKLIYLVDDDCMSKILFLMEEISVQIDHFSKFYKALFLWFDQLIFF